MSEYKKTERTRSCSNGIAEVKSVYGLKPKEKMGELEEMYNRCETVMEIYRARYDEVVRDNIRLHHLNEDLELENKKLKAKI